MDESLPGTTAAAAAEGERLPPDVRGDVTARLVREHGLRLLGAVEVGGGMNNRLFRLITDGPELLLKLYRRDGRGRLERERLACAFLRERGLPVALVYTSDERLYYGVYSFEEGRRKGAAELVRADVDRILDFCLALEAVSGEAAAAGFLDAYGAHYTLESYLAAVERVMGLCSRNTEGHAMPEGARALAADAVALVSSRMEHIRRTAGPDGLKRPTPLDERRLGSPDLGPHNMLFRRDGVSFLDLEYFGWDDPLDTMSFFLSHDQILDLDPALHRHAFESYCARARLTLERRTRLLLAMEVEGLLWLGGHLLELTPAQIERRRFAMPHLDPESHVADQLGRLRRRYTLVAGGDPSY